MKAEELRKILGLNQNPYSIPLDYEFSDETLVNATKLAQKAHAGVTDKMGKPYFDHPARVCDEVKKRFGNIPGYSEKQINYACILAILHDVVEDTEYTPDMICNELQLNSKEEKELKYGLSFVTHDKNKDPYSLYIKKIAECPIIYPVWVKYCDIRDNIDPDRLIITEGIFLNGEDFNRVNKYVMSIRILLKRLASNDKNFKCNDDEINIINNFRTSAERKRMNELNKN